MNDKTEPAAERWRALAADAYAVADGMTDPDARLTMLQIAYCYDRLARQAEQREGQPSVIQAVIEPGPEPTTA